MPSLVTRIGLASAVFLWTAGGGAQPPHPPTSGDSLEKEIALGKALAAQIERQLRLLEDPAVADYVRQLGERLARVSGARLPVTVRVTDSKEPYAYVLPGGFLYLSAGLIAAMETEAELAGIMAHAVAHVAARHGIRPAGRSPVSGAILIGGWDGVCTRLGAGSRMPVSFQSTARGFEDEADWMALDCLRQAQYDPQGLVAGFQRLPPARSSGPPPVTQTREFQERLEDLRRGMPECVVTTSAFNQVKARLKAGPLRQFAEQPPRLEPKRARRL